MTYSTNLNSKVEELDKKADSIIFKYSIIATLTNLSSFFPGTKVIVDVVGDTLAQYKMLNDLAANYKLDKNLLDTAKIIAVVADNFIAKKLTSWAVNFIPIIGNLASTLIDFAYTYAIGKVFKYLFREAYTNNQPVDYSEIPEICENMWKETLEYVKNNWKGILGAQKLVLDRYDIDLQKIADEIRAVNFNKDKVMIRNMEVIREIYNELKIQRITKEDFFESLRKIEKEMSIPSIELIKAMIINAENKNEEVDPDLISLHEILEKGNFDKLIKGLLPKGKK